MSNRITISVFFRRVLKEERCGKKRGYKNPLRVGETYFPSREPDEYHRF